MRSLRSLRAPSLVLMVALGLGCSGDERGSAGNGSGSGGNGKEDTSKVLLHYRANEHKSLDPVKQFDQASHEIIHSIYDTLLEYHYLKRPYELEPGLLAEMPVLQEDGITYLFTLRQGVHFIDDECFPDGKGRELNADDAIWNIKRFADANLNQRSWVLLAGFIAGLDEFRAKTKELGEGIDYDAHEVAGLRKLDDYRFEVVLTRKNPLALFPFAMASMAIVPREAVAHYGDKFADNPVGTGPYYMENYSRRGVMTLKRNPNYHGRYPSEGAPGDEEKGLLADAGKQLPLLEEIRMPLIEESQPRMLKFERGEIDWIGLRKDDFQRMAVRDPDGSFRLNDRYADRFEFYVEPQLSAEYIAFNMLDPTVGGDNVALRKAIAYALNTPGYIELILNGRAMPLKSIIPQPIAGSEEEVEYEHFQYDPEKAKALLAEAGYPGGKGLPTLTLDVRSTTKESRQAFEYIRNDLAQVGIKAKAEFSTFSAYLRKIESGNFQMTGAGWMADYPDGENFFQLLYGPNKTPGPNSSNFDDPEYNALYEQIRDMENGPERFALFQRMQGILNEKVPVVLRYNGLAFGMHPPTLRNMKRNMMWPGPYKFLNKMGNE